MTIELSDNEDTVESEGKRELHEDIYQGIRKVGNR